MRLILNIGLDVKATSTIAAHVALEIVKANGFAVCKHRVVQSDTEPTLVVEVARGLELLAWRKLNQIAVDLEQDCIAAYNPATNTGALIGPRAAAWGAFNREFFFTLSGQRLAQPTAA